MLDQVTWDTWLSIYLKFGPDVTDLIWEHLHPDIYDAGDMWYE